jgi:hypothetical protein
MEVLAFLMGARQGSFIIVESIAMIGEYPRQFCIGRAACATAPSLA